MALTTSDVARLAALARIELSEPELARLAPQLDVILNAVAQVTEVAADDVQPMSHPLSLTNVFRADTVTPSLPLQAVIEAAPASDGDRFRVPQILGDEQ